MAANFWDNKCLQSDEFIKLNIRNESFALRLSGRGSKQRHKEKY